MVKHIFYEIAKGAVRQVSVWQILWYVFRLQIRVAPETTIMPLDLLGTERVYKRPITGTGKETHMDIPVF